MPRPSMEQVLELWHSLQDPSCPKHVDPLMDEMIGQFADALLDKWQYADDGCEEEWETEDFDWKAWENATRGRLGMPPDNGEPPYTES